MLRRSVMTGAAFLMIAGTSLLASGVSVRATPLHAAAAKDDVAAIRKLLLEGAAIEARDNSGATALLVATHGNRIGAAKALIEAGANVNAKDNSQDSAYLYAGAQGHLEILRMTLSHGADLASTNRYGGTALIPAAERGHVETVRTLIQAGVAVDHINKLHWTALLEAIILGSGGERHRRIVDLLVKAGANVNLADGGGVTPLQHARSRGFKEIEQILLAAGAR
jgi:ankyrin repeat protein